MEKHLFNIFQSLSVVCLVLVCKTAFAISVVEKSFEQLLEQSDDVIYGLVTDSSSRYGDGLSSEQIYTYVQFSEVVSVKNPQGYSQNEYLLRIAGGRVGRRIQVIPGVPKFLIGSRYILFIKGNNELAFPLVGVNQGVLNTIFDKSKNDFRVLFDKRTLKIFEALNSHRTNPSVSPMGHLNAPFSPQELVNALNVIWNEQLETQGAFQ